MFEELRKIFKEYSPEITWVEFDMLSEQAPMPAIAIREITGLVDENLCNKKRSSTLSILCKVDKRSDDNRKFFQGLILFLNNYQSSNLSISGLTTLKTIDNDEKNNHYYEFGFNCYSYNDLDL